MKLLSQKKLFCLFAFVICSGLSQKSMAARCTETFANEKVLSVFFPETLRVRAGQLNFFLKESKLATLNSTIGSLFAKVEQHPDIIGRIAHALSDPLPTALKTDPAWLTAQLSRLTLKEYSLDEISLIEPIYFKLRQMLSETSLKDKEILLIALLLKSEPVNLTPSSDLFLTRADLETLETASKRHVQNARSLNNTKDELMSSIYGRRVYSLLQSPFYRAQIVRFVEMLTTRIRTKNDPLERKANRKIHKTAAKVILNDNLILGNVFLEFALGSMSKAYSSAELSHHIATGKVYRSVVIEYFENNIIEFINSHSGLSRFRGDSEIISAIFDYILFGQQLAKPQDHIKELLLKESSNLLLLTKSELTQKRVEQNARDRKQGQKEGPASLLDPTHFKAHRRIEVLPQTSNKRKAKKVKESEENRKLEDTTETIIPEAVDFIRWTQIPQANTPNSLSTLSSNVVYQTRFLRRPDVGVQKFTFSEKVLKRFSDFPEAAEKLLRGLVYGPIARSASLAGIKKTYFKDSHGNDLFEARPSANGANNEAAWRLILVYNRAERSWVVFDMVAKGDFQKAIRRY